MNYSFKNTPAVKEDIIQAVTYYKEIAPDLAKQFYPLLFMLIGILTIILNDN